GDSSLRTFTKKRYRYVGKEKDQESGLYYYGARYYAPWTCRFISVDPLAADYPYLTPYNYAGNKPITHKDIDGLQGTGDPPVENNVARQDNTRVATNVPNADNLKPVEPAEANVYQINKETGAAVKIDVSGLDLSKSDQAKLEKGGEFIYRNNRLSITSKETVNALNNPSEAGPLTEFALGKLKEDFKTYEGNFPENYYEDFGKALIEKSIELKGADSGIDAAQSFVNKDEFSEGMAILHAYESYVTQNADTGFDKAQHFIISATTQYNQGGLITDAKQYGKEVSDYVQSKFGKASGGFDSKDMLANNKGQAFGKALYDKYHPKPAEPRFRRFGE
ncbi:MAG: RHS repeat-associated core domain-containing protein, partial [Flavobacteriales bacterium]|nr:RHS repeat-associated core domain-containing protein [Flavobacteriales bacterium]